MARERRAVTRLPPDRAVIGYVTGGWNRHEFTASLLGLCLEGRTPVDAVLALESGPNISTARNRLCADFLTRPGAPQWLFMCDTDMVLPADTIDRLVAAADPADVPVLGGLCWSLDKGEKVPTMYELVQRDGGQLAFTRHSRWPQDTVVPVSATGAACLLIHRDALLAVEKHANDPAAPWFRETAVGAPLSLMGEDLTFCLRCAAAGIPVHVHTGIKVGHMKTTMLI
jgi:GT2 family glycosyltransferase